MGFNSGFKVLIGCGRLLWHAYQFVIQSPHHSTLRNVCIWIVATKIIELSMGPFVYYGIYHKLRHLEGCRCTSSDVFVLVYVITIQLRYGASVGSGECVPARWYWQRLSLPWVKIYTAHRWRQRHHLSCLSSPWHFINTLRAWDGRLM